MNEDTNIIYGGLQPLPVDERDFSLGSIFSSVKKEDVPMEDWVVCYPIFGIKDQKMTDFCTAYALTSVSEDQELIMLSPEYQFLKTKEISGDFESWGADLRSACKSITKFGSLPSSEVPDHLDIYDRDSVLNSKNWSQKSDEIAKNYKKASFFRVNGPYDTFDNIVTALWTHRKERRTILAGIQWRNDWTFSPNGIIRDNNSVGGFGHAFKFIGLAIKDGKPHLVAQLSNGIDIGDKGLFYFPREIVNSECEAFGQFMFKDMPREQVEDYLDKGIHESDWFVVKILKRLLKTLF